MKSIHLLLIFLLLSFSLLGQHGSKYSNWIYEVNVGVGANNIESEQFIRISSLPDHIGDATRGLNAQVG
ncbi:MAG: hypothetical protein AAGJ93_16140, partial [Bacteroidota bacterium]